MDEASGEGWIELQDDGSLNGKISFTMATILVYRCEGASSKPIKSLPLRNFCVALKLRQRFQRSRLAGRYHDGSATD